MIKRIPWLCLTAVSLSSALLPAVSAEEAVEHISVTASRSERDINEIASYVSFIDSDTMQQQLMTDIRDLVRYEPGVSVEGGGRFGLSGFNIRGINGDRVLMLLDGVPLSDEFSFGPALSARRDFIDIDLLQSVEIIRGPASTLYGSDAIGGVVAFTSKAPKDMVAPGESLAGKVKLGYASAADEGWLSGQLAAVQGNWQWLLSATRRQGHETESYFSQGPETGSERLMAEPQRQHSQSGQAKLIYSPSASQQFTFIADHLQGESKTDLLSQVGTVVRGVRIDASQGDDERQRSRLQFNYQYNGELAAFDKLLARLYWQQSDTEQDSVEQRFGAAGRQDTTPIAMLRNRHSEFSQHARGASLQFDKAFANHYLIYGTELQLTDSDSLRDGDTRRADNGDLLPEGSVFPTRDFPRSSAREVAIFVQDEMRLLDGKLTLSPGLRYDKFNLSPKADALFSSANPGVETQAYSDSEVSAKFGALYRLSSQYTLWSQFAEGFRIPPFDDINVGFTNFAGGYTSLPNANLAPERVKSWELGIRARLDSLDWEFSLYHNRYDNFIESLAVKGFNPATGLLEFQARNLDKVTIRGADARINWYPMQQHSSFSSLRVTAALSWLDSKDSSTGQALDSIMPPQAVVGIGYGLPDDDWSLELVSTAVKRATVAQPTEANAAQPFAAPGYVSLDLLGHLNLAANWRLNWGVFNLTDRKIWSASEVRGRTTAENVGQFTQPGRNITASVSYRF